jgi:membrane protease YdiL (CAAX protease family)
LILSVKIFTHGTFLISPLRANTALILIISPIAEELLFRGVLLELLLQKKCGRLPANMLVSLLFTALHIISKGDLMYAAVFLPSAILSWHYCRFRAVTPVILAHSAYNLSIY